MAIFQDIRPRQSSLGVAAGKNRLQVHLQQEVYGGGLSDVAPTQPGTLHASTEIKAVLSYILKKSWLRNVHAEGTTFTCFISCQSLTANRPLI